MAVRLWGSRSLFASTPIVFEFSSTLALLKNPRSLLFRIAVSKHFVYFILLFSRLLFLAALSSIRTTSRWPRPSLSLASCFPQIKKFMLLLLMSSYCSYYKVRSLTIRSRARLTIAVVRWIRTMMLQSAGFRMFVPVASYQYSGL